MRKLHVIGYSEQQGGLVLAARKGARTGSFVLALDGSLLDAIDAARAADDAETSPEPAPVRRPSVSSGLTPREIQARLRSGRTVEEVAVEAGVDIEWVDRFAAPVLAEQFAAVDRAGRSILHTPRKGPSDRPLDASVRRNLAERGVSLTEDDYASGWSARHLVDTDWLVSFRFRSRGRPMMAEWLLNVANGSLTTRNRLGADLGFLEPGRRMAPDVLGDGPDGASSSALPPGRRSPAPVRRKAAKAAKAASRPRPVAKVAAVPKVAKVPKVVEVTTRSAPRAQAKSAAVAKAAPTRRAPAAKAVRSRAAAAPAGPAPVPTAQKSGSRSARVVATDGAGPKVGATAAKKATGTKRSPSPVRAAPGGRRAPVTPDAPKSVAPKAVARKAVPSGAVPSKGVPSGAVPSKGVPSTGVPSTGVPSGAVPSKAVSPAPAPPGPARRTSSPNGAPVAQRTPPAPSTPPPVSPGAPAAVAAVRPPGRHYARRTPPVAPAPAGAANLGSPARSAAAPAGIDSAANGSRTGPTPAPRPLRARPVVPPADRPRRPVGPAENAVDVQTAEQPRLPLGVDGDPPDPPIIRLGSPD